MSHLLVVFHRRVVAVGAGYTGGILLLSPTLEDVSPRTRADIAKPL
jgi:hypothetical protein